MTIAGPSEAEIVVKKSRFIGQLYPVSTMEEAQTLLNQIKKQRWDASHNCSAMLIGESGAYTRCSDDGEPQGTAGVPMLEALKRSGLTNILAVVTRYFGGTLLGAGGLARAYTAAVCEAVQCASKVRCQPFFAYHMDIPFKLYGRAEGCVYAVQGSVKNIAYADQVSMDCLIPPLQCGAFETSICELSAGKIRPQRGPQEYRMVPTE